MPRLGVTSWEAISWLHNSVGFRYDRHKYSLTILLSNDRFSSLLHSQKLLMFPELDGTGLVSKFQAHFSLSCTANTSRITPDVSCGN